MKHSEILIVEDSRVFAVYLSDIIKTENNKITLASGGKEGIRFLQDNSYNLVLLDLELPDFSGIDILKEIRKKYNQIELPVMVVSATHNEQKIVNALESGANDFVSKPFAEITLKVKVKNMLQLQSTNAELLQIYRQRNDIFDFSPVPSIVVDESGVVKEMNHAAYEEFQADMSKTSSILCGEVLGCDNAVQNKGSCGKMKMCPDCVIRCSFSNNFLSAPKNSRREGWFKLNINNQVKQLYLIVSTICLRTNNSDYFLLTFEDITDRKQAEIIISSQNNKLSELNATKDKFFSIIAHDLRSPFSSILGFSELLADNIDNFNREKIIEFVNNINESAKHTLSLLENLLEWAGLQRGLITPSVKTCNLQILVYEICSLFREMASGKNIALQNYMQTGIYAKCDPDMTKTILRNILSNAVKFTKQNGTVSLAAKQKEGFIEIQVRDSGVGIPALKIPVLFNGGKKNSTMGTAKENGTGLGLLLCRELVEKQGGKIWVESEENMGTAFYFTVPSVENQ